MTVYGTDPEFFAGYVKNDKLFALPPIFFRKYLGVQASKDPRHPVFKNISELGAIIHEDGAAFEMSITPSLRWQDLFANVNEARKLFSAEFLQGRAECLPELLAVPSIGWEVDRWAKEGVDFFMSTTFGCDPDYDAFDYEPKEHVIDASKHPLRYGGGHIHFSGVPQFKEDPLVAVHCLAFTAGLAGTLYSTKPEQDKERTYLYGKPGKFRPQMYGKLWNNVPDTDFGIEYRTLSNLWTSDLAIAEKVFMWADIGINVLFKGGLIKKLFKKLNNDVQTAIVNCDQKLAGDLLDTIGTYI